MSGKSDEAMRTIGEVAASLDLPAHVLRFWETRFKQINPLKRAGGRRFYRKRDIELVIAIRRLLYDEGYTIRGVQRILKEAGVEAVLAGAGRRQGDLPGTPPLSIPARATGGAGLRKTKKRRTPPSRPTNLPLCARTTPIFPESKPRTRLPPSNLTSHWRRLRPITNRVPLPRRKRESCARFWPRSRNANACSD